MSRAEQVGNETPDLVDLILTGIRANQLELNTCMPATVTQYNSETLTATVQPSFKRFDTKGNFTSRPQIEDVPVVFPRSGARGVYFPLAAGDPVLLVFSQRSLDTWLDNGGEIDLRDTRLHNLNDAIAIPGIGSSQDVPSPVPATGALDLRADKIFLGDPNGAGSPLCGLSTSDLVQAMAKLIEKLLSAPLVSAMGPVNFDPTVVTALQELQAMIEGFEP